MKEKKVSIKKNLITKILAVLFVVSNIVWVLSFFTYRLNHHNFQNPHPLIDISRSFVDQEHFLSTIEPLRKSLKDSVARYEGEGFEIGLYFEYLNTGANISINQDKRFWPASLSKMPTAFVVMKKIERGEWKLSNELVILYEDRNDAFGDLYKKPAGTKITIEELLHELLVNSDDTAHRVFIRNLSEDEFEEMLFALGMTDLYDLDYTITAKEYSRIFRSLYTSSFLNREYSTTLLEMLSETSFNEYLQAGVPEGIVFSHKIGTQDVENVFLDSGIVYTPNRPYLMTVMIQVPEGGSEEDASVIMKDLSEQAYNYVANY